MPIVVLAGTLDTKGPELLYLRDRVREAGCETIVVDCGVRSADPRADISADEVAAAAGVDRMALAAASDRGAAVMTMARGLTGIATRLQAEGRLQGMVGIGGSGGSSIVAAAMQALPMGVPKLLVSTMAAGDTTPYVGTSDIALLYPIVDLAGLNHVSERILANAAGAIAGMARAATGFTSTRPPRPVIAATMYGVTTPCVETARSWLEEDGYEVLAFHATGSGGRAMEKLIRSGVVAGVLDVTTTELTDELVGGAFSAGPDRLEAAGAAAIPQAVSLGATEIGTFGPPATVPRAYRERRLQRHNESITLMRIDADEAARLGHIIADKLARAHGPVALFLPAHGLSSLSVPGAPFADPEADRALFAAVRDRLPPRVELIEMATHINDPAFGAAMARWLATALGAASRP